MSVFIFSLIAKVGQYRAWRKTATTSDAHHEDDEAAACRDPAESDRLGEARLLDPRDRVLLQVGRVSCELWPGPLLLVLTHKNNVKTYLKNNESIRMTNWLLLLTWKPMQSQWWARLADFRFQYSRKVTAEQKFIKMMLQIRELRSQIMYQHVATSIFSDGWFPNNKLCRTHKSCANTRWTGYGLLALLTPERHEDGVEDGAGVVEQVGYPGVVTNLHSAVQQTLADCSRAVTWYSGQVLQFVHCGHIVMLKLFSELEIFSIFFTTEIAITTVSIALSGGRMSFVKYWASRACPAPQAQNCNLYGFSLCINCTLQSLFKIYYK